METGGPGNTVKIWNSKDGSLKNSFFGHTGGIKALDTLQNGNLVSGSSAYNYMPHIMQQIQKEIDKKKWSRIDVNETDLPWSPTSGSGVTPDGAPLPTAEMP